MKREKNLIKKNEWNGSPALLLIHITFFQSNDYRSIDENVIRLVQVSE